MNDIKENEPKSGFIFENKDVYITKNNKLIFVERFKELCKKHGIADWMKELKKL